MRKPLWIILALLFAAIGAPNARADSFVPTFTCAGTCVSVPTAPDVSFPTPTTIEFTWFTTMFSIALPTGDLPTDMYAWDVAAINTAPETSFEEIFTIFDDNTNQQGSVSCFGDLAHPSVACEFGGGSGSLSFAPVATPEPSSVALMLAGIVLLWGMRKRIA